MVRRDWPPGPGGGPLRLDAVLPKTEGGKTIGARRIFREWPG